MSTDFSKWRRYVTNGAMRPYFILPIILMIISIQGCCAIHTPFDSNDESPVPIVESYISLQSKESLKRSFASAVVIADGWAVTNRHVLEKVDAMHGYMAGGLNFPVQNAILSERLDLAFFRIPHGVGKPISIGSRAQRGDRVFSAGTTCTDISLEGIVVATVFKFYHVDIHLRDAPQGELKGRPVTQGFVYQGSFINGFSGGPVVNVNGELVGINQGRLIKVLSADDSQTFASGKVYGLAYHIQDVLTEVRHLLPSE